MKKRVKIKFLKEHTEENNKGELVVKQKIGDIVEASEENAQKFVELGYAEYVEKPSEELVDFTKDEFETKEEMRLRQKRNILLPKDNKLVSEFAEEVAMNLNQENTLFLRPEINEVVEIVDFDGNESFNIIKPNRFITHIEKFMKPVIEVNTKYGKWYPKKSISGDLANTVLQSEQFQKRMPKIKKIYHFQIPLFFGKTLQFPNEGYDIRFKSWLSPKAPKISNPDMPIEEAKEIIEEIYKEFCFKSKQDKTHAVAQLLTPFVRGLFPKPNTRVPLFIVEANRERAGKDYLIGISQMLYDGFSSEEPPISTGEHGNHQNDELRKKIVAALMAGKRSLHFANNKGYLNNSVLESLITTPYYTDRVLGKNDLVTFSNELDLSISGNAGMTYTADLANRSRFIRLFLEIEDANSRKFENPNLHKWVFNNRELILSALYSFVREWVGKGKPKSSIPYASFPDWADVVGGIMECVGYDSPCEPDKEGFAVGGDTETIDMKRLFEICYETFPNAWIKKNKIINLLKNSDEEIFLYFDFDKKADQTKFGMKLNKYIGRILSDIKFLIKDKSVKGSRREFMFKSVNPVNVNHPPTTPYYENNISNATLLKVNKVNKVNNSLIKSCEPWSKRGQRLTKGSQGNFNNLEKKPCDSCGTPTKNLIQNIPICEKCAENVAEVFK